MKHLEPEQQLPSKSAKKKAKTSQSGLWKFIAVGMTLVIGIGYGMSSVWNPNPIDDISDAKKSEWAAVFSAIESIKVEPVADQDLDVAIDSMNLKPIQRKDLQNALLANKSGTANSLKNTQINIPELVWVNLWDSVAVDGDIVNVSTAGYNVDIFLQKNQTRISLPVDVTNPIIMITGVQDGGGGITLGVQSGASAISLPVLKEGQQLPLSVSY